MEAIGVSICKNMEEKPACVSPLETQLAKLPIPSEINNALLMAIPNIQERPPRWGAREKACAFGLKWAARKHK